MLHLLLSKQPENCLACHCKHPYEFLHFIQSCNPTSLIALMSRTFCKHCAALLLNKQPENFLAYPCKYTYEFLHLIQSCNNPSLMHSTHVKHPLQALCCTCCPASNLKTFLLTTANTPMSFFTSYSPAIPPLMHSTHVKDLLQALCCTAAQQAT